MLRLPQELLQQIIQDLFVREEYTGGHLYSEAEAASKDDLLACSRACRALRLVALPFLFRTVSFYINEDLTEATRVDIGFQCRSLSGFTRLLDTCPAVRENVQELRVRSRFRPHIYGMVPVDVGELQVLFQCLPRLCIVRLDGLFPDRHGVVPALALAATNIPTKTSPQTLQRFELCHPTHVSTDMPSYLVELLCSFSSIDTVNLVNISFLPVSAWQTLRPGVVPTVGIRCLDAMSCVNVDLLLSLLQVALVQNRSMRSLLLSGCDYAHIAEFGDVLRSIGSDLVDLYLPLEVFQSMNGHSCEHRPLFLHLSLMFVITDDATSVLVQCQSLEHLSIEFDVPGWVDETPEMLLPMLAALHEHPLASLTRFTIVLIALYHPHENLHEAASVLAPTESLLLQIPGLKQIALKFVDELGQEPDAEWYRWVLRDELPTMLPNLHQSGILVAGG